MRIARYIFSFLLIVGILAIPAPSHAQIAVGVSIRIGPPALPVYVQPICPGPGYIWAPGYWAYGDDGYFWVPGTWVIAPEPGLLWTPGYWGWNEGFYVWHAGYWGPTVGFYGGINYGFGYPGAGFFGGYWRGGNYYYNRSVTNVNVTVIHNVYERTVINEHVNRVSFNGGPGGIHARPDRDELRAEHERHIPMTREQSHHFEAARSDRDFRASVNHGRPEVAATPRAGEFHGRGPVDNGRMEHTNRPPADRSDNRKESNRPDRASESGRNFPDRPGRDNSGRGPNDRPPSARGSNGHLSNSSLDEKHQRETDKMQRQQDAERQKLQQRHDQEQQQFNRQNANQQRQDQLRQRQQQQTDQMNRKHDQQSQKMQQRQQQETQKQENRKPNNNRPH